jgi:uncharacterized protein YjaZ
LSVVETQRWLDQFVKACNDKSYKKKPYFIQCDVLCEPLKKWFPDIFPEELHYHLLQQGLFDPSEWRHIKSAVQKMEELNVWGIVEREYQRLKKKWNGPETPIFIFPIQLAQRPSRKNAAKKWARF